MISKILFDSNFCCLKLLPDYFSKFLTMILILTNCCIFLILKIYHLWTTKNAQNEDKYVGKMTQNPNHKGEIWTKFGLDTSVWKNYTYFFLVFPIRWKEKIILPNLMKPSKIWIKTFPLGHSQSLFSRQFQHFQHCF